MLPFFFYGPDGNASDPTGFRHKWMDCAYPYIKSEAVFNCPDDNSTYKYTYYQNLTAASNTHYGSYGINVMYRYDPSTNPVRTPPTGRYLVGLNIAQLQAPATTVWIGDM